MVLDLISGNFKTFFAIKSVSIDDKWDQLNRNYLVMFCILSGSIMTLRQNLGSIIECIGDTSGDKDFANENSVFVSDYCSAQGLFTLKELYNVPWPSEIPYPGISPWIDGFACNPNAQYWNGTRISCPDPKTVKPYTRIYHVWYMFVPFYFCALGIAFYFPYCVFRHLSGIYDIKPMLNSLSADSEPNSDEDIVRRVDNISRWLYIKLDPYMNNELPYTQIVHKHSMFYTVVLVKLMYLMVSLLVFYGTHCVFEQGNFATYGYDVLINIPTETDYMIMDTLFPKMAACHIDVWNPTGLKREALLCVLPQNIANQYFFLMFWAVLNMVIIANVFSIGVALSRFVFVTSSYKRFLRTCLLKDMERYHLVFSHVGTTGRYILQLCAEQSNPKVFEDLMEIICSLLISNYHKRKDRNRPRNNVNNNGNNNIVADPERRGNVRTRRVNFATHGNSAV